MVITALAVPSLPLHVAAAGGQIHRAHSFVPQPQPVDPPQQLTKGAVLGERDGDRAAVALVAQVRVERARPGGVQPRRGRRGICVEANASRLKQLCERFLTTGKGDRAAEVTRE